MKAIIYFSFIFMFILTGNAYAYLDPNSSGGLIAFLVAIFAGIAFYFKKIFYKIKSIFTGKKEDIDNKDEK